MTSPATLEMFSADVRRHLFEFYLPFWQGPALDEKHGGWMSWLSNDLHPDRTKPKGLIVNARILWAFSSAHRAAPDIIRRQMAERAFEFVTQKFWDARHGGAYWQLDDHGHVLDDSKKIYGQAFYIYSMAEFYRAFGNDEALTQARELFDLIEHNAHDTNFDGYTEICRRDWSEAGPDARLSEKDMNEKKSMNNHLHVLEAYTNLYRVWPDLRVAERLRELIELFLNRILDSRTGHMGHFFDEQWKVKSDSYTYGHDIEASWLLCEAAEELHDDQLLQRVQATAVEIANAVLNEAVSTEGGLSYEGREGKIIDAGKECWPQAEGVVGFINAYQITRKEKYLKTAFQIWSFAQSNLVDRTHGEWFWRITPEGKPDQTLPKVSEWKGPYHVTRACLETINRINHLIPSN